MNEQLLHLVIASKITLAAISILLGILCALFLLWIYAEISFWAQRKHERIEAVRDKMDGIELKLRARRHSTRNTAPASSHPKRQSTVIKMANLDKTSSARNTKYSKITINSQVETV